MPRQHSDAPSVSSAFRVPTSALEGLHELARNSRLRLPPCPQHPFRVPRSNFRVGGVPPFAIRSSPFAISSFSPFQAISTSRQGPTMYQPQDRTEIEHFLPPRVRSLPVAAGTLPAFDCRWSILRPGLPHLRASASPRAGPSVPAFSIFFHPPRPWKPRPAAPDGMTKNQEPTTNNFCQGGNL